MTQMLLAALLMAGALASTTQEPARAPAMANPLAGSWTADLSRSRLDAKMPIKSAELTLGVSGNVVTVSSSFALADGQALSEKETLRADGTETAATFAGIVHFANWVGPQVLAVVARKGNQNLALITYEVSADGQTLTTRTSGPVDQMLIFRRRPG
jgi:hypothetical protein